MAVRDNRDFSERLKQGADDLVLWLTFAIAWFCFIAVFNWLGLLLGWFPAMLVTSMLYVGVLLALGVVPAAFLLAVVKKQ